jgi:hypothetical protein
MRHSAVLAMSCALAVILGWLPSLGAGVPADSLWVKAVALSERNDDLVPGLMKMHMQEVDKHGQPKDRDKYHEVWSRLWLGDDGEVEYEMLKTIENGEDVTEKEKAKEEEQEKKDAEKDEGDGANDDSETHEMQGYSPFGRENQARISVEVVGDGGIIDGKPTSLYRFSERTDDDIVISGKAWLEKDTGAPVKVEYAPDPLPKRVKHMMTTMHYEHVYPDSLIVKSMFVEVTGGILFIKKHFHMNMEFDDYWRLPEGYGEE